MSSARMSMTLGRGSEVAGIGAERAIEPQRRLTIARNHGWLIIRITVSTFEETFKGEAELNQINDGMTGNFESLDW